MCRLKFTLGLLAAVSAPVHAADLLCTGTTGYGTGQQFETTALAIVESTKDSIEIKTVNGWARGKLGTDPQTYMGVLTTDGGVRYWYNLNRYTGAAVWGLYSGPEGFKIAEFVGTCDHARPKF